MKANILIKIVVLSMLIPMGLQAQLGGLLKKPTAAGLLGDVTSGMDFFNVAAKHYSDALLPKEEAAKLKAEVDALQGKSDSKALSEISGKLQKAADEKLKAGKTLDAEAKKHVQDGQAAFTKGLAKWAGLAAALALAAKDGGADAAMAAAIPVVQQAVKDLPAIKKMGDAVAAVNKIK